MRRYISLLILLLTGCVQRQDAQTYYTPGEFETQQAIWMGWGDHEEMYPVTAQVLKIILPKIRVHIVSESDSVTHACKAYLSNAQIDTALIQFHTFEDNTYWMRDHGAIYVRNSSGDLKVVDFEWGGYGYRRWLADLYQDTPAKRDSILALPKRGERGKVDSLMAAHEKVPIEKTWIKMEGGALETNGKGTLILNEQVTFNRNENKSKEELEKEFRRVLGVTKIIWLPWGLAEDPHIWQKIHGKYVGGATGGHTDEFVRFADNNTILLAWVSEEERDRHPLNSINYARMMENFKVLSASKNEKGQPFKIVKVPLPNVISQPIHILEPNTWEDNSYNLPISVFDKDDGFQVGDTVAFVAASSYLNFQIVNDLVLLPTYVAHGGDPAKEESVKEIFNRVFPGKELIFIDCLSLNWQGGGLHCSMMNQPEGKPAIEPQVIRKD